MNDDNTEHRKQAVDAIVSHMMQDAEARIRKMVEAYASTESDYYDVNDLESIEWIAERLQHRMEKGWDVCDSWCLSRMFMDKFPDILRMMARETMGCPVPDWAPDAPQDDTRYGAWIKYLNKIADSLEHPEYDPEMMDADESKEFKWAVGEIAKNIHLIWN